MSKGRTSRNAVKEFRGEALRWEWRDAVVELTLDFEPLNEIGTVMLAGPGEVRGRLRWAGSNHQRLRDRQRAARRFFAGREFEGAVSGRIAAFSEKTRGGHARVPEAYPCGDECAGCGAVRNHRGGARTLHGRRAGTCAGLRLDRGGQNGAVWLSGAAPRLDPGFGGIPRLRRDVGNGFIRDLLFTGRTVKAESAQQAGLVSHLRGRRLRFASGAIHGAAGDEIRRGDPRGAKKFLKPIPYQDCAKKSTFSAHCSTGPW